MEQLNDSDTQHNRLLYLRGSILERGCCCKSEKWKDSWKDNNRGQKWLKVTLCIQFLFYFMYIGLSVYIAAQDDETKKRIEVEIFHVLVWFWLAIVTVYFLWHSINRSIVVELITFGVSVLLLNVYFLWRLISALWIEDSIEVPDSE